MRETAVFPGSVSYDILHAFRWSRFLFDFGINSAGVLPLGIAGPLSVVESRSVVADDHHLTLAATPSLSSLAKLSAMCVGTVLPQRTELPTDMRLDSLEVVS